MGVSRLSTIKYVVGTLIMLGALAAFLVFFVYSWLDVSQEEFISMIEAELTAIFGGMPLYELVLVGAVFVLLAIIWRIFGFGSMDP